MPVENLVYSGNQVRHHGKVDFNQPIVEPLVLKTSVVQYRPAWGRAMNPWKPFGNPTLL
jgi:hypothetical protein